MINRSALESSLPLAGRLDQNRIFLTAVEGSPLAALVNATRSGPQFNTLVAPNDFIPDIENIAYMANVRSDTNGPSPHDCAMDEVVETCIVAVQRIVSYARLVVRPVVSDLTQKVSTALSELTVSKLLGMEVVIKNVSPVFENSSLENAVRRFEATPFDNPEMRLRLPDQSVEDIIKLMASGSGGVDKDIKEWVSALGDSWLIWLWENAFQQKQYGVNETRSVTFRGLMEDKTHGANNAMAMYLIARRLVDSDPLEGTEMDISTYERIILGFRDQCGLRLTREFDDIKRQNASGTLVLDVKGSVTTVNGALYRKWIEDGGSNEVLFGNMVDTSVMTGAAILLENAEKLKQLWQQHENITKAVEDSRRFQRTKEIMAYQFDVQLTDLTDEEKANMNPVAARALFREQLQQVATGELATAASLYLTCLKLVCRARFYYTDAERILSTLDEVANQNPEMDVREAGLVAMTKYVAYWLTSQMKPNPM